MSEQLKLNYGEILFGTKVKVAKYLGGPLGSYRKKNDLLNLKSQAFNNRELNQSTNLREPFALALQWIKAKRAKANYILLITDGEETHVPNNPNTGKPYPPLEELRAEAIKQGIRILVLAMGDAKKYIPRIFDKKEYRFGADDGSDIPDMMIQLFEQANAERATK